MSSSPFVGEWEIKIWRPDTIQVTSGIPTGAFLEHGILTITQTNDNSFNLKWPDQSGHTVSVSGLQFNEAQASLNGHNLPVDFGLQRGEVNCDLSVTFDETPDKIKGTISLPQGDLPDKSTDLMEVGQGTFTATANPGSSPVDTGAPSKRTPV